MTGGAISEGEPSTQTVNYLDLVTFQWHDAPPLNDSRQSHSSFSHRGQVFVVSGIMSPCTVESLNVKDGADAWKRIINGHDITNRFNSAVAVLSDTTFTVFGGCRSNVLADGFLVDLKKEYRWDLKRGIFDECAEVLGGEKDFAF